jgi:hypothetical protein
VFVSLLLEEKQGLHDLVSLPGLLGSVGGQWHQYAPAHNFLELLVCAGLCDFLVLVSRLVDVYVQHFFGQHVENSIILLVARVVGGINFHVLPRESLTAARGWRCLGVWHLHRRFRGCQTILQFILQ